jgi:hypothetical protein
MKLITIAAAIVLSSTLTACGVIGKGPSRTYVVDEVLVTRPPAPRVATVKTVVHDPLKYVTDICYPPGSPHYAPCLYIGNDGDGGGNGGGSGGGSSGNSF